MERKRFCVTFFLRRARTNKAGLAPILARITTNGVSKEVYIQCSVPADRWNQSKEWATGRDKLCQQVNAYLNEYRVNKARQLILDPRLSLKDIGAAVGYSDANYFTRVFKRLTGQTPSEYRMAAAEKAVQG